MKGLIWNCRGVEKRGMAFCLTELIRDHALDFICLQETMKMNYNAKFFRKIDLGGIFFWKWIPFIGKSGGILCGVRQDSFGVLGHKIGEYILRLDFWDNKKNCKWSLLTIYGPAHDEFKNCFLAEIASFCHLIDCPYIIGGDFNILRHSGEKISKQLCLISMCLILLFIRLV
jgi:hypothetical protein